ncbi:MBL fold metallo-hydrolase [Amycolatopsis sp. OK19-0408]|uniref:MBL fold metallo-hydrolase n=1 Tax=Amycolatopsis iheyensis TaxID=2945988 RepID=A0A9X2SPD7_9PSEU|nr:MBL fold metallo-hydrolase [Amycolatopsis iheyensis]MCR6489789.1 MBL fold metallo-hydrolase [Amycolatopsis iheyensis]
MSQTPAQLLDAMILDAARAAVESPMYAEEQIDVPGFAKVNREKLLDLIACVPTLRAELARKYRDDLADTHPRLVALLGADGAGSVAAAKALRGPRPLRMPRGRTRARVGGGLPSGNGDGQRSPDPAAIRRSERFGRRLAEVRAARDQARAQRDYARTETDRLRRDLEAAEQDRDESLAVSEALRAELAAERARAAKLATDVPAAAAVLRAALLPPPAPASVVDVDIDPREREAEGAVGAAQAAETRVDPRISTALAKTEVTPELLLAILDGVLAPPAQAEQVWVGEPREIVLTPLGGGTHIGGSCMLVSAGDVRLLVDAGMRPRKPMDDAGPEHIDVALTGRIDAIVITHAHNDHAGYVPALTARYPNLPVICTPDTAALLPTMWNDSVRVFERARDDCAQRDEPLAEPPYGQPQVLAAQHRIREVRCGRVVEIADGVTITLFPAGHILGAAGVVVSAGPNRITVTGDVSDLEQASVPGLVVPEVARGSDLLVIESTYCGDHGSNREAEVEKFVRMVAETVGDSAAAGGRVLVPAFALGRAQEVALTLRNRLPDVPVLIDGMAKEIATIYEKQTAGSARPLEIYGDQVSAVRPGDRQQLLRTFRRGVVVTTSGMLTAGPAVTWARSILPDPDAALLIAGYQDEDSPGFELLELAEGDRRGTFALGRDELEVNARVAKFGLSAHADRRGLSSIITDVGARDVMLVHGVASKQRDFADNLTRRGLSVVPTRRWQLTE